MYYFEEKQIPELYQIRHRHDSDNNFADYGEKILDKTVSPFFYGNLLFSQFADSFKRLVAILFDNVNIVKNFKNYNVDKYYYKQKS